MPSELTDIVGGHTDKQRTNRRTDKFVEKQFEPRYFAAYLTERLSRQTEHFLSQLSASFFIINSV